jgi:hypothetical protein
VILGKTMKGNNNYFKSPDWIIKAIGIILFLVGLVAAFYGPAELYCFYLFSDGGRFHYEGFGFGSMMFASIAWQIIGYYLIAFTLIPLGWGHLRLHRWARIVAISLLYCSWIVGAPLIIVFMFMLSVKEFSTTTTLIIASFLGLSYLIAPRLLIQFYKNERIQKIFETKDLRAYWIESMPMPIFVLAVLNIFYIIILHVPIFLNGVVPLFGIWLTDLQGVLVLDVAIVSLCGLTWGVLRQKTWAWWGSMGYFSLILLSLIITLTRSSFQQILSLMNFPPTEMKLLENVPLQGFHFLPFIGFPLIITLIIIVKSKRYFEK